MLFNVLASQSFDYERNRRMLIDKLVVCTKFDIYISIFVYLKLLETKTLRAGWLNELGSWIT